MSELTEKGKHVLNLINEYFPKGQFTASMLSDACGEKVYAATLNSIASHGFINKLGGSPVEYSCISEFANIVESINETSKGCDNTALAAAKRAKNDEFYTRYEDIEVELMKYRSYFKDKVIYLPCDDPISEFNPEFKKSAFWDFFVANFENFDIKRLIATHIEDEGHSAYKIWIDRDNLEQAGDPDGAAIQEDLTGTGDFRSPECCQILDESDIVITNPPFSLFREFVSWILAHKKRFLIIGNQNAFAYKEIFPYLQNGDMWTGYNSVKKFLQPDGTIKQFGNVCWFTNLPTTKREEPLILTKSYKDAPYNYPVYDNYNAINVDRVVDIPKDYDGVMGVPITFLDKLCPTQFEIIGVSASWNETPRMKEIKTSATKRHGPFINGKEKYKRLFIKRI